MLSQAASCCLATACSSRNWGSVSAATRSCNAIFQHATHCCPAVTVNISSIGPLARNLTQNGDQVLMASDDTPALLFRPVVHLFGRKSRNLDGSQVTESFDLNAAMEEGYNFINRYIQQMPGTAASASS